MLTQLISDYGAMFVAAMIALESLGIPVPGETVLVATAIYAGTSHGQINPWNVALAGAAGGTVGNIAGYLLGREYGYRLLVRYGGYAGLTPERIKIGRYLFWRQGTKVVFVARFVAVLRSFVGILAGASQMPWPPFIAATVAGALAWSVPYVMAAYYFGDHVHRMLGPAGFFVAAAVLLAVIVIGRKLRQREAELAAEAEKAFPGPLPDPRRR
jgi:membrane protein DedA with SNARE-associated domain